MVKRLFTGRWWVITAPPSLYLTSHLTYREARKLMRQWGIGHVLTLDITGRFTRAHIKNMHDV